MFDPFTRLKKRSPGIEGVVVIDPEPSLSRALIYSRDGRTRLLGEGRGDLRAAVAEARRKAGFEPKLAVVGVGGQNAWCLTTTLRYNRQEVEAPIDKKELAKVTQMLEQTARLETEQQLAEFTGELTEEFVLVDSDQPQFTLDGQALEVSFFTAYSPSHYINRLKTDCQDLKLNLFALFSLLNSAVAELSNDERPHFNAVVIKASERETEVGICFGGRVFGNRVFSLGTTDPPDIWVAGLEISLGDFTGVKQFPDRLILVGADGEMAKLKDTLENHPWARSLAFADRPFIEIRGDISVQALTRVAKEILEGANLDNHNNEN